MSSNSTTWAELTAGDHRLLYFARLMGIRWALEEDEWGDEVEPLVPQGSARCTAS
ncbi:hypothetical protein GCM10010185_14330 [Saccharothrix coeruleofusca]|uniref:Uncharacterized protein n=1 Tax=Saccharothrix coeruleofusca TaxID=33919 RepID=A0A918EDF1_9PSEU|nr:hypothetical protein GCM10010185_14330 [Saccharothrix coeruleofusca]